MNIIEEQNLNEARHSDVTGNMDAPASAPHTVKKVYSKPMLVVLLAPRAQGTKDFNNPGEGVTRGSGGRYSPS